MIECLSETQCWNWNIRRLYVQPSLHLVQLDKFLQMKFKATVNVDAWSQYVYLNTVQYIVVPYVQTRYKIR